MSKYLVKKKPSVHAKSNNNNYLVNAKTAKAVIEAQEHMNHVAKEEESEIVVESEIEVKPVCQTTCSKNSCNTPKSTVILLDKEKNETEEDAPPRANNNSLSQKAIELITTIDPNNKLNKNELVVELERLIQSTSDLELLETINYLLQQLYTLEEKCHELTTIRQQQQENIKKKYRQLSAENFKSVILLDNLDGKKIDVDECQQIFTNAKTIYSTQTYSKPNKQHIDEFTKYNKLKKMDTNTQKNYRL